MLGRVVHLVAPDAQPPSPAGGRLGVAQNSFRTGFTRGGQDDPNARRDENLIVLTRRERCRESLLDAVGDAQGGSQVTGIFENDRELVLAEVSDRVAGARQEVSQTAGDLDEHEVARHVAQVGGDVPEAVEVEGEQGERVLAPALQAAGQDS